MHIAKDARLKVVAVFDERYYETKDFYGKKLDRGNMLVELLLKNG